ncbi:hypothetical protein SCHPADRAFT_939554 [Schizopora paradoxa]|uniref:Mediator complex subunit 16 n=1 Tax=Schizopora paradoxa TaxID=27342 RepID=A0A0H2RRN8_9AGAM|nr:hypothetical protein SCHPADRAFT_939554 [Schizopora paradoxa]
MNMLSSEPIRTPTGSHFPSDIKMLGTPTLKTVKGTLKQREHEPSQAWQLGWWDLEPLASNRKPPLQWTSSSTILSAHPTDPQVVCLHFPSNQQFSIPSPPQITSSPTSYEPPTTIISSARDNWMFAYFPGVDCDGVGCIWRKGPQIDNWIVKEWWTFPRGAGVVSARWLQSDREWVTSDAGVPTRLPMLGPPLPLINPVLIVVTESHLCNIYYIHPQTDSIKMLGTSLRCKSTSKDGDERHSGEPTEGPRGLGRCARAAIGFGYDESSIIIATQSIFLPGSGPTAVPGTAVDMSISISMPPTSPEPTVTAEWTSWSAENTIELCEVTISVHGNLLNLSTNPMHPLRGYPSTTSILTDLVFVPTLPATHQLPSTPTMIHRNVTPMSSPAISNAHVTQSPGRPAQRTPMAMKGSPPKMGLEKGKGNICLLHLICASLDVSSYSGKPKSELTLFSLIRAATATRNEVTKPKQIWLHKRHSSHNFPSNVITYLRPCQPSNSPQMFGTLVGLLNSEGPIRKAKDGNHLEVGEFTMLKLPDLQVDETWESSKMVVNFGSEGVHIPFGFSVSPNHSLIASVSSSSMMPFATTTTVIHNHPSKVSFIHDGGALKSRKQYAASLGVAVQKRANPSDILRSLTAPSVSIQVVEEVLMAVMHEGELNNNGIMPPNMSPVTYDILGMAIDVYKLKASHSKRQEEKKDCEARSSVGHDICSMVYCNRAWEDCTEGEGYDLDAIWHLLGVSGWTIELLEKILKETVLFSSESLLLDGLNPTSNKEPSSGPGSQSNPAKRADNAAGDPFGTPDPLETELKRAATSDTYYNLLHLIHPFPLECLINLTRHVARLRLWLTMITAKSEKAQMAKEMLLDIVDSSGINLEVVVKSLMEARADVKSHSDRAPDIARRCLASLKPHAIHRPMLKKTSVALSNAVDKSRLFFKPEDLLDNMEGLSISPIDMLGRQNRDVITKRYLSASRGSSFSALADL